MSEIQNSDSQGLSSNNQPETQSPPLPEQPTTQQNTVVPELSSNQLQQNTNQQPISSVSAEEKLWGFIAYVPFLAFLALVMRPQSEFIKLHGRQGLLISLIFFFNIFFYLIPFIGFLLAGLVHLSAIFLIGFSMYQALMGNWWKTPVLGEIADMLPVEAFVKVTREAVMGEKAQSENNSTTTQNDSSKQQSEGQGPPMQGA